MIRRSPLKRSTKPIKKRNVKRQKSEFARCYGSKERVAFVRSLSCAACGVVGYSENAHLLGNGGMSRKADADTIGPLCGPNVCHFQFDEYRSLFDARYPDFDPEKVAADTEAAWLAHKLEEK